jgi:hypothetical protein
VSHDKLPVAAVAEAVSVEAAADVFGFAVGTETETETETEIGSGFTVLESFSDSGGSAELMAADGAFECDESANLL